jgi:hypothetical protein
VGGEVGDAVAGEAGGDQPQRRAEGQLGEDPDRPTVGGDLAEPVGVRFGEVAQGGEVVVEGGAGPAEHNDNEERERRPDEDGRPPAGAAPGDDAVGGEADGGGPGGDEESGEPGEDHPGEVDEAVVGSIARFRWHRTEGSGPGAGERRLAGWGRVGVESGVVAHGGHRARASVLWTLGRGAHDARRG